MVNVILASPRFSVRLYKSISRKPGEAGLPTSSRYADKDPYIDLTPFLGDGSSIVTSKNINQPAGTFQLTFADRPKTTIQKIGDVPLDTSLETVYGLVEPMDLVEIRMWSGKGKCPDPLPIKMRGFVTEISRARQAGPDGRPLRTVTVSGQDYGKILQTYQILYLPNYEGSKPLLTGFNFFEQFGEQARNVITGGDFIKMLLDKAINVLLDSLIPKGSPMPRTIQADIQAHGMMNNSYMQQEGSVYELLKSFLDVPTWNEFYIEDREEGVFLVWRPLPYYDLMNQTTIQKLAKEPIFVPVPDNEIVTLRQERNDESVFNFYWCTAQRFDLVDDLYRRQEAFDQNANQVTMDYPNSDHDYYGLRTMYADTVMGAEDVDNMNSGLTLTDQSKRSNLMTAWLADRRQTMILNNRDNVVFERGSMEIKGGPVRPGTTDAMKAGDYVTVLDGRISWDGYVISIQDNFQPFRSYRTVLQYERGTGFAMRVSQAAGNSPWLTEQVERHNNLLGGK
ncbi:hypothetical protein MF451_003696 [Salmonella enterica subsp. enterica serovar Saintpaul]|nr:hypothetical protein [Salmonella enterica subsp. enterica serovar Saintpaul]